MNARRSTLFSTTTRLLMLLTVALSASLASAQSPCVVPDDGAGTVSLPPVGCDYLNATQVHKIIDGLPPGTTIELAPIHKNFICRQPGGSPTHCGLPGGPLSGETENFSSSAQFTLHGTGLLAGLDRTITIPNVQVFTATAPRTPGQPVQSFDTQMQGMQGQLPAGDPDFDLLRVTAGNGFGLPSPGHTTLTQRPGNTWAVDSFFDITYRIDFIGSDTSTHAILHGHSGSTTATIRMSTIAPPIPTLSQWGMILAVLLMVIAGTYFMRRRAVLGRTAA